MKKVFIPVCVLLLLSSCVPESGLAESGVHGDPKRENQAQTVHPRFSCGTGDIEAWLNGRNTAAALNPEIFLDLAEAMLKQPPDTLRLVDKNHTLPSDYIPAGLVNLESHDSILAGKEDLFLTKDAASALDRMSRSASDSGIKLKVSSAYRSYSYQDALFRRYADSEGEDAASRFSARAGTSQHQLGTAVDLGDITNSFAAEPAGDWMKEHAGEFGWSLSYPAGLENETGYVWESWHWRWIGREAVIMQDLFFDGVQQRLLEFWDRNASRIREAYTG